MDTTWVWVWERGEYGISGEDDERAESLSGGRWAVAGRVAWASMGGESGGVDNEYVRAGSRDGGDDKGGGAKSAERLLLVGDWVLLFMARAIAERVELLREPGERWIR
jgi:hypothetical protein